MDFAVIETNWHKQVKCNSLIASPSFYLLAVNFNVITEKIHCTCFDLAKLPCKTFRALAPIKNSVSWLNANATVFTEVIITSSCGWKKCQYSIILSHNLNESVVVVYSVEVDISCLMRLSFFEIIAWKASIYGVFSGPYFPAFGPNTEKYGPEKTPYLDTFHTVNGSYIVEVILTLEKNIYNLYVFWDKTVE